MQVSLEIQVVHLVAQNSKVALFKLSKGRNKQDMLEKPYEEISFIKVEGTCLGIT